MGSKIPEEKLKALIAFHGHWCPGLATGIKISEVVLDELGRTTDEEIVAVAETDNCAVDAIQFLTGCTVGKGNMIVKDLGKSAFSFYRRSDGKSLRIVSRPDAARGGGEEYRTLQEKSNEGALTPEESERFEALRRERSARILESEPESLFIIGEPLVPAPPFAPMKRSVQCDACGESVMETKARLCDGRILCLACFERLVPRP